jgi:hypothetical protein
LTEAMVAALDQHNRGDLSRQGQARHLDFIHGLRGELQVTFEEGTWATWLYDLLKPHVGKLVVCDPRKNSRKGNKNDRIVRFGLDHAFHHYLSSIIPDRNRNTFLVHIHADIFSAGHKGRSSSGAVEPALKTYSKSRLLRNSVDRPKINEQMPS